MRAQAGELLFDGQDVTKLDRDGLYGIRRRMGMLFQFGALFTDLSVFDNVAFPLREHSGLPEHLVRDIVLMKLNAVGLRGARDLMPSEVSGGMARRVALARAIALDPDLVMYDEPFAGLDPISLGTAAQLIRQLNDTLGITSRLERASSRSTAPGARKPRNSTRPAMPRSCTCRFNPSSMSPLPQTRKRAAGSNCATSAAARRKWSGPFWKASRPRNTTHGWRGPASNGSAGGSASASGAL